jgi:Protein phosphatase inhibitor.
MFIFQDVHTVRLKLRKPESKKKVQWQSGTVDNENMNKKKSKCEHLLCIFVQDFMSSGVCSVVKSFHSEDASFWGVMLYCWVRVCDVSAGFSAFS